MSPSTAIWGSATMDRELGTFGPRGALMGRNLAPEFMHPAPACTFAAWIAARGAEDMFLTAIGEAEVL